MAGTSTNLFRVVTYDSTNPSQPPELMAVPDEFYPILGKIVIQWAVMEQECELLTLALMEANGSSEPGWQKRQFNKRWGLLLSGFTAFAASEPGLLKEVREADRLMKLAKPVRDGIAHQRIMMGHDNKGNFLRFEIDTARFPWSQPYYQVDLSTALLAVHSVAGRLFRLMTPDHPTAASLPGRLLLQRLPNMDHRRFPMPQGRQPPPQS